MTRELDCRGLACPAPVMQVRDLLAQERPAEIAVIVDNEPARENVSRFLAHQGFQVTGVQLGSDFRVTGTAGEGACAIMPAAEIAAIAGDGGKKGKTAFYDVLREKSGDFRFTPGLPPEDFDAPEIGYFMKLLMTG